MALHLTPRPGGASGGPLAVACLAAMLAGLGLPAPRPPAPVSDPPLEITEWTVPWPDSRPRDPFPDREGRIWFVGQVGNYIARFDPDSGRFRRYQLEKGTLPHSLTVAGDGRIWYTGNANGTIGRLDPATGRTTAIPLPADLGDPHTLAPDRVGHLWFTVQAGNAVGRLDTATGAIRVVRLPAKRSLPYGIALDSKQRPWFAEFGANRVGTIDPASFTLREYTIHDPDARPRRLVIAGDRIYLGDYNRGKLIRLDPATGQFAEWELPAGARSGPYAMAGDERGRIWLVETGLQPNRFVVFDPGTERFGEETPIAQSGGIVVRNMSFEPASRSFWFGTDAGTLGRATIR
jgi:virginiamycin B lyase